MYNIHWQMPIVLGRVQPVYTLIMSSCVCVGQYWKWRCVWVFLWQCEM